LETAVAEGRFRNDLYHRLSQITLRVPPLRQRIDDIAPLARYFLAQQDPSLLFSPAALEVLTAHSWPGNIRELRNVVTKAAVLAQGPVILPSDLAVSMYKPSVNGNGGHAHAVEAPSNSIEGMERRMIMEALEATNGHQQKAATRLGISRRTLSRKLKLYESEGARAAV
jgi:DNA-binding NtrC family response regulator